jgi:hypothetical protein
MPIRFSPKPARALLLIAFFGSVFLAASAVVSEAVPAQHEGSELPTLLEARQIVQVDRHEEVRPDAAAEVSGSAPEGAPGVKVTRTRRPRPGFLELLFGRAVPENQPAEIEMDARMLEAADLAQRAARRSSINRCWRYVKRALQAAEVVDCYPQTALAKQAAIELPKRYGFARLEVDDPFAAPVGAVLVYGGRGAGHVEIRTAKGFVSDHASPKPSPRPLIGVFVKPLEG